eukprot:scaffold118048_cov44-Prasinocladus_malaysianus.AAC.1
MSQDAYPLGQAASSGAAEEGTVFKLLTVKQQSWLAWCSTGFDCILKFSLPLVSTVCLPAQHKQY